VIIRRRAALHGVRSITPSPWSTHAREITIMYAYRVQQFLEAHMPIVFDNPLFCFLVLGMSAAMAGFWFVTRHKAALIVSCATLLYFVPFVRF
jgi:hypothetical protein